MKEFSFGLSQHICFGDSKIFDGVLDAPITRYIITSVVYTESLKCLYPNLSISYR